MKEKLKNSFRENGAVYVYRCLVVVIELMSIMFIGCKPFISNFIYFICVFGLFSSICLMFKNRWVKLILASIFLLGQIVANVGFIYLYDSNGTFFEWAMMNQRNDAFATIEELHLRWSLVAILISIFVAYLTFFIIFNIKTSKNRTPQKAPKFTKYLKIAMLVLFASFTVLNPSIDAFTNGNKSYAHTYLYGDVSNKYQQSGITSNAIYEFFKGTIVNSTKEFSTEGIEEFVYDQENPLLETSEYFGISKENNLVYILVESWEWYVFLEHCTPEQSEILYPNINKFLRNSIYADNYHSREKTDTAEMLAILGSNPTDKYVNYDFAKNTFSWSLPNMFRQNIIDNGNEVKHIKSYHQNSGSFYNRDTMHASMGFDDLVSIEDMSKFGVEGTFDGESWKKGTMTMDSHTIDKMQDDMFPMTEENEQFLTYWITYITHGSYNFNQKFEDAGYYAKLDEIGAYPAGISQKKDYLRTYAAAVMDFDKALGIMMDKLEANGQLDNTTIILFSDHNTYYHNLANYAKDIDTRYNSELFRVPFMIYDQKLKAAYEANEGTNVISKFTTGADLIPTIFDIFGIKGYENLYFGSSMFVDDVESIIFSRAYGIFITDKIMCYGADELLYKSEDYTKADFDSFIERAELHLEKLEYMDKIMNNDYFKHNPLRPIA